MARCNKNNFVLLMALQLPCFSQKLMFKMILTLRAFLTCLRKKFHLYFLFVLALISMNVPADRGINYLTTYTKLRNGGAGIWTRQEWLQDRYSCQLSSPPPKRWFIQWFKQQRSLFLACVSFQLSSRSATKVKLDPNHLRFQPPNREGTQRVTN